MVISGATAAEERTVDWAMRRFRVGGLEGLPPLEVFCTGRARRATGAWGLTSRVGSICAPTDLLEPIARKYALHEMAHAWIEANLADERLVRFLRIRGIATWNDQRLPWKERGAEQAAEIITWGLGEGEVAPLLPTPVDAETLASLYVLLTGRAPINGIV